jgi:transposase
MLAKFLTDGQVKELRELHRKISESKKSDRIKAILLLNEGYSEVETAKILLRDESSIWRWLDIFKRYGIKPF